nr:hypothetical protein [uncultured Cohaesibacter sp.]
MRSEAARQNEVDYNERLKQLRGGHLDVDIFRMMGGDVPLATIAHRLEIYPYHLGLYVDRVLASFRAPDDAVKPFPWLRGVAVK